MPLNAIPEGYEALVNPSGVLVAVPKSDVENNIKNLKYKIPTTKDFETATLKKDYGEGFGNELQSSIEGALSGATFGLSRNPENVLKQAPLLDIANQTAKAFGYNPAGAIVSELGISTQDQALRKEFNPTASGLGEVAGIGASLLMPEASLPGVLASSTGKVGAAATRALGEGAAAKIAGNVIDQGLQGLAYGAAQPISESALGDPTLTASKIMQQIGIGGLIGGALGGVGSALGLGAKRLIPKGISQEAQSIVEGEAQGLPRTDINRIAKARGATPEQVEEFIQNRERITNSPRLATKLDPVIEGQPAFTIEQSIRDSYEGLAPRIKELAEANQGMLEQATISKAPTEIADIFETKMKELGGLPVKGKQTNAAIDRIQGFVDQLKAVEGDLDAQQIKGIIGEIDSDLESFYAGKIGKSTTKEERVLLGLRRDLNETLKKDMTKAGFSEFETNLAEMRKLIDAQSRLEKSFGNATGYQRALSELSKADQGYKSGVPLVQRGTKKGVDWLQALDDLGEISGQDFRQMYHDRALHSKLFPNQAVGPEEIVSWPSRLVKEGIDAALDPTGIPKKIFKGAISKGGGFFEKMNQQNIDDLLMGRSSNPGAVKAILGKFGNMTQKGSQFLEGPMSNLATPAVVKFQQFISDSDSVDHADKKLETLMALEKAQKKADQQMSSAIKGIFSGNVPHGTIPDHFLTQSPKELADSVDELKGQINQLMNEPEMLLQKLADSTQGMTSAPNVVSALNMTAVRALQFLSQKMNLDMPGDKLPLDPKYVPSKNQMYSLTKTMRYINQPWDVLKDIATGMISKEGKDVLENVHPELYNDMKAQVMNALSEAQGKAKHISMTKRLALSYFLGMPLDSSMTQTSIASNQATFAMPNQAPSQQNPTPTNAKNLKMSQNMMTPLQKVAAR